MNKKFKNAFGVQSSSKFLIDAFIKAIEEIGWKRNMLFRDGRLILYFDPASSEYNYTDNIEDAVEYYLPTQWEEAIKAASEFIEEKPKVNVGDWIKTTSGSAVGYVDKIEDDGEVWVYKMNLCVNIYDWVHINSCYVISKEEVEEAFTKEANRRGYKPGVNFKSPIGGIFVISEDDKIIINPNYPNNICFRGNGCVWEKGQWAKIIQSTITIDGYEAQVENGLITFGCVKLTKEHLNSYKHLLESAAEPLIQIKGVRITTEIIDDLLNMFDKGSVVTSRHKINDKVRLVKGGHFYNFGDITFRRPIIIEGLAGDVDRVVEIKMYNGVNRYLTLHNRIWIDEAGLKLTN